MLASPASRYQEDLLKDDFEHDPAQQLAVDNLQRLFEQMLAQQPNNESFFSRIGSGLGLVKEKPLTPIKGLYFWGGVGRGKTYLVDTFFDCLPFEQKMRMHFHRFMHRIHNELKQLREQKDPLTIIGKKIASETRILCFDEFVVSDVADAVILAKLMKTLFAHGVTLVATSNVEPKELYKGGLQRALFLPAIGLVYQHTDVLNIDSGVDYRLRFLDQAEIYFNPTDQAALEGLEYNFSHLAPDAGVENATIEIEGRDLQFVKRADGVIWFEFAELCDGPRSQNDYMELARCFHSVILSNIPVFDRYKEDQARRFINLIDVFYDHNVKVIISAHVQAEALYQGSRVEFEFQRTVSRLKEMQSHDYLALNHIS